MAFAHGEEYVHLPLFPWKKPVHGFHEKRRIGDDPAEGTAPGVSWYWGACFYTQGFGLGQGETNFIRAVQGATGGIKPGTTPADVIRSIWYGLAGDGE